MPLYDLRPSPRSMHLWQLWLRFATEPTTEENVGEGKECRDSEKDAVGTTEWIRHRDRLRNEKGPGWESTYNSKTPTTTLPLADAQAPTSQMTDFLIRSATAAKPLSQKSEVTASAASIA